MISKGLLFAQGATTTAGHNGGRPVLTGVPLALLPVANRPLMDHGLETLWDVGVDQVAVVVDEEIASEMRMRMEGRPEGSRLTWIERDPEQGLSGVLAPTADFLEGEGCILHLGESLVRAPLAKMLDGGAEGPNDSLKLLNPDRHDHGGAGPRLKLADDPTHRHPSDDEAMGIYLVGSGFVAAALERQDNAALDQTIAATLRRMTEQGGRSDRLELPSSWRYQPRSKSLLAGNRFALESLSPAPVRAELKNTDIQGPVQIHPTAVLEDSVIRGPAVIGADVRLKDAYIGPYCSIGDRVRVEGTEIEHSVILNGARICHLGSRLEASIIGPEARVFREFRLPRGLRLDVGRSAEISLS